MNAEQKIITAFLLACTISAISFFVLILIQKQERKKEKEYCVNVYTKKEASKTEMARCGLFISTIDGIKRNYNIRIKD